MNTRRVSGMVQAAGPGGQALLETLDAFKRKHVSQNKEIIHRNSDLMRSVTVPALVVHVQLLSRRLRPVFETDYRLSRCITCKL